MSIQANTRLDPQGEEIAPGVTVEFLENGRIVVFTVRTIHRDALERYEKRILAIINQWPANQPFLHVEDFAAGNIAFTPLVRDITARVSKAVPESSKNVVAIVVPKTFMAQLAKITIERLRKNPQRVINMFYSRETALAWIKTHL